MGDGGNMTMRSVLVAMSAGILSLTVPPVAGAQIASQACNTITIVEFSACPPKALAEIKAPASVAGPPTSVAVSPREDIALVTSAMRIDTADPTLAGTAFRQ